MHGNSKTSTAVKTERNDKRASAHIPNYGFSKTLDPGSDPRKKSNSLSDENNRKHLGSCDAGIERRPSTGRAYSDPSSQFHKSLDHKEGSKKPLSSSSDNQKSVNCLGKVLEKHSTVSRNEIKSSKFEMSGRDQNDEKRSKHDVKPNSKQPADVVTLKEKTVKSFNKSRENCKISDGKSQKSEERRKDEKSDEIVVAKEDNCNRRVGSTHLTSSSGKSSSSEKKSEHLGRDGAADAKKSSASKKHESSSSVSSSNVSLVSKVADRSTEHRRHSSSTKYTSDSCKPQEVPVKGTSTVTNNRVRDPESRTKSSSSIDRVRRSDDKSVRKRSSENSKSLEEKNLKGWKESSSLDVKKELKHSKGSVTENIGKNSSRPADEKTSEFTKQIKRNISPT